MKTIWVKNLNPHTLATPRFWKDYVDMDSDVITWEEPTDENIKQSIVNPLLDDLLTKAEFFFLLYDVLLVLS